MNTITHEGNPVFRIGFEQEREPVFDNPARDVCLFWVYTAHCICCGLGFQKLLSPQQMHLSLIDPVLMTINEAEAALSNRGCDHARLLRPQIEAVINNLCR